MSYPIVITRVLTNGVPRIKGHNQQAAIYSLSSTAGEGWNGKKAQKNPKKT
jgi:hypothetical protein